MKYPHPSPPMAAKEDKLNVGCWIQQRVYAFIYLRSEAEASSYQARHSVPAASGDRIGWIWSWFASPARNTVPQVDSGYQVKTDKNLICNCVNCKFMRLISTDE